jgi:hypothetical protein
MNRDRSVPNRRKKAQIVHERTVDDRTFRVVDDRGLFCINIKEPGHQDIWAGPWGSRSKCMHALREHLAAETEG